MQPTSPTSSTPLLESGGLEKQQKFTLDIFATRQFGIVAKKIWIVANFDKMPTCEKSHGNGDFCTKFSCVTFAMFEKTQHHLICCVGKH